MSLDQNRLSSWTPANALCPYKNYFDRLRTILMSQIASTFHRRLPSPHSTYKIGMLSEAGRRILDCLFMFALSVAKFKAAIELNYSQPENLPNTYCLFVRDSHRSLQSQPEPFKLRRH